jgi:hypothetical protein
VIIEREMCVFIEREMSAARLTKEIERQRDSMRVDVSPNTIPDETRVHIHMCPHRYAFGKEGEEALA